MADDTSPAEPLQLVEVEADGYCDPETGVCVLPGAGTPTDVDQDHPEHH
jgi:hypothetical protein